MSFDLIFWRYEPGVYFGDRDVFDLLSKGEEIEGLDCLPQEEIKARFDSVFSTGWKKLDGRTWDGSGGFQLDVERQHFVVMCYQMPTKEMKKIIKIGREFGCQFYDPQMSRRFG